MSTRWTRDRVCPKRISIDFNTLPLKEQAREVLTGREGVTGDGVESLRPNEREKTVMDKGYPSELPEGLPAPEGDGAAAHLPAKWLLCGVLFDGGDRRGPLHSPWHDRSILLPDDGPTGQRYTAGLG